MYLRWRWYFRHHRGGIHTKRVPLRLPHCVGITDTIDIGGVHTVDSPENAGECIANPPQYGGSKCRDSYFNSLSGVYEFTLDVALDNAGMFFGSVFTVDCSVERLFGSFCSGRLPKF